MQNDRLDESQAGIKISGRNINNLRYAEDTTLMAKSEEELKTLLMKVKEESEKAGLKFNIQKTQIMAFGPITSWEIDGETVETGSGSDFIFGGSKITSDGDSSQEIKRCLLLRKKAMTNTDSILKSRNIIQPTKICLVKAMVFPVVMYGCERWAIKKASVQFSSGTQSCPTLCDPMNHSTPGLPVHHQLPEFIQTHIHRVSEAIQPSHPLSFPSPPAPSPSQHQGLFPMSQLFT